MPENRRVCLDKGGKCVGIKGEPTGNGPHGKPESVRMRISDVHVSFLALFLIVLSVPQGCSSQGSGSLTDAQDDADFLEEVAPEAPEILQIQVFNGVSCVLTGELILELSQDCTVTLVLEEVGSEGANNAPRTVAFQKSASSFRLPLLGLSPESNYRIQVTATNSVGLSASTVIDDFATPALPEGILPPLELIQAQPERMQPGVTLFSSLILQDVLGGGAGLLVAVDEQGRVVWYHRDPDDVIEAFSVTAEGTLLHLAGDTGIVEMDMLGNVLQVIPPSAAGVPGFHHEVRLLPDGNLVTLGIEVRPIVYQFGDNEVTYNVVADVVTEFTRDGELVHAYSAFDFLDPSSTKEDFHLPFWDQFLTVEGGTKDWMHTNGIAYDARDDSFILSVRHLDWLVKVDRASGVAKWRMGENGDFAMTNGGEWFYHTHAPEMLDNGHIMVFDNGNRRPGVELADLFSRGLELSFDEESMGVTTAWEYRGETPFYSQFVGDCDRLENGNVLINDGGRVKDQTLPLLAVDNTRWCRLIEVTDGGEVVWELEMKDFSSGAVGTSSFRAIRIDSLYAPALALESR